MQFPSSLRRLVVWSDKAQFNRRALGKGLAVRENHSTESEIEGYCSKQGELEERMTYDYMKPSSFCPVQRRFPPPPPPPSAIRTGMKKAREAAEEYGGRTIKGTESKSCGCFENDYD